MDAYPIKMGCMQPTDSGFQGWNEVQPEYFEEMEVECEKPNIRVPDNYSITEIFNLFFTSEVLQDIVSYTNQTFESKRSRGKLKERDEYWHELSEIELLKYIIIIMTAYYN
ncbi:unnamed protein product [Blepharisma stoltei]|uniref:PiggyBac transposable element-derived protein domain-containing protein n=1 Tax=Blepharisma stoltei TaxID=1481888 RepID=A0AAU9K9S4_9CILI|nr:unnamed protein product [Blepharisma stoltei]